MKRINKQGGFTLLELLVVVAIIAIIAGAVISAISGQEERAGQGVALHTMGALENSVRQYDVLNQGLPGGLDSLICVTDPDNVAVTDTGDLTNEEFIGSDSGDEDGNGELDGGLAPGLAGTADGTGAANNDGKVVLRDLPAYAAAAVIASGLDSLRYADVDECEGDDITGELAQTKFWDTEGAADVALAANEVAPILIIADPTEIGQDADAVVGLFGIGNFTDMSSNEDGNERVLSRGPVDGNVDGDGQYYSHFSLAVKLGETGVSGATALDQGSLDDSTTAEFDEDEIDVVAILDSDGDGFDDEVAEFAGLEDE